MISEPIQRSIQRVVEARGVADGVGVVVKRTIGGDDLESLDPFLTLDEFRMTKPTPSSSSSRGSKGTAAAAKKEPTGFPDHPHRGFETVTLMLQGHFQHQDFTGRQGTIGPGDVQWMTAGRGIVHAEMPYFPETKQDQQRGGGGGKDNNTIWGLQLWVNLPKRHKLCKPQYQDLSDDSIPRWNKSGDNGGNHDGTIDSSFRDMQLGPEKHRPTSGQGITVKVIAGESHGVVSKIYTRTPTMYLEIKMEKRQKMTEWIPKEYEGFVYVLQGKALFGGQFLDDKTDDDPVVVPLVKQPAVQGRPQQMLVLSPSVPALKTAKGATGTHLQPPPLVDGATEDAGEDDHVSSKFSEEVKKPAFERTSRLNIETIDEACHFVLIAGEPCREPVFRQGPFVMTSKEELDKTFRDYEEKKRGFERAKDWVSTIGQPRARATEQQDGERSMDVIGNSSSRKRGGDGKRKGKSK